MKFVKIGIAVLLLLLAAYVIFAPIGPAPGVMIGGKETTAPATWPDTSDVHEILLEVAGTLPRVVTIWMIQVDNELYVVGAADSGWVTMLGQGGPVRMRLDDSTYPLRAEKVTDNRGPILNAYVDKYREDYPDIVSGFPDPETAADSFALFKLERP